MKILSQCLEKIIIIFQYKFQKMYTPSKFELEYPLLLVTFSMKRKWLLFRCYLLYQAPFLGPRIIFQRLLIVPDADTKEERVVPFTNVKLNKLEKPEDAWKDGWESTLKESSIYKNMAGDALKAILRIWGWLSLDLVLYGPGTITRSLG